MGWPEGTPSPRKGQQIVERKTIKCPCGTVFEERLRSTRKYCSLDCSYIFSELRGRKIGCTPWNKGLKGVQEAWNKGKPHSDETKNKLREVLNGGPHSRYGRGGEPSPTMLLYAFLCSAGFEMDKVTVPIPTGSAYLLDFAHRDAKVNIEIDGSSHIGREKQDTRRDAYLKSLGWKIIRIRHA